MRSPVVAGTETVKSFGPALHENTSDLAGSDRGLNSTIVGGLSDVSKSERFAGPNLFWSKLDCNDTLEFVPVFETLIVVLLLASV